MRPALARAALAFALAAGATLPFWPGLDGAFLTWDDVQNFVENPHFRGLGAENLRWAATTFWLGVYQPAAWVLFELQHAAFGLAARGYHAVSLALHAANAVLLWRVIAALLPREGAPLAREVCAALAALLFAVHPLRVEAVSWVSCQPYLPATFFALLSARLYLRGLEPGGRRGHLWGAVGAYAAALCFKAIAAPLPLALLLVDHHRGRFAREGHGRLLWEKLPFFALAAVFAVLAVQAKDAAASLAPLESTGLFERLALTVYALGFYLEKTLLPLGLSGYYPVPKDFGLTHPALLVRAAALAALVALGWRARRSAPAVLTALACFAVLVLPNAGLVRIGKVIAADRYTYLSSAPLAALVAAGLWRVLQWRWAAAAPVVLLALPLGLLTARQTTTFATSLALWGHALETTAPSDAVVRNNYGRALALAGDGAAARRAFEEAVRLDPGYPDARSNLGLFMADDPAQLDAAAAEIIRAIELSPTMSEAYNNLGVVRARQGRVAEAAPLFKSAAELKPTNAEARKNFGLALHLLGDSAGAERTLRELTAQRPDYADGHCTLGTVLEAAGRADDARAAYRACLAPRPGFAPAEEALRRLGGG